MAGLATSFSPDIIGGERASAQVWKTQPLPDAIICYNDLIAIGLMASLKTMGLKIPEDLSVAAFGNHPLAAHLTPSLTLMEIPSRQLGERSAELLIELLEKPGEPQHIQLYAVLRPRESTARVLATQAGK